MNKEDAKTMMKVLFFTISLLCTSWISWALQAVYITTEQRWQGFVVWVAPALGVQIFSAILILKNIPVWTRYILFIAILYSAGRAGWEFYQIMMPAEDPEMYNFK